MSEGADFDGSELEPGTQGLEQATETSGQVTEQGKSVEQPPQQTTVEPPQQQAQPGMPEQFKDYTSEEWFNEWNRLNSDSGRQKQVNERYKQELSNTRQQLQAINAYLPQLQNRQPAVPTSLPGQEARQEDLTSKYWEDPIPVLRQVVGEVARNVLQENERQRQMTQAQSVEQRRQEISRIDDDELQNLRLDESINYTPEHEALMESLAKRDPEIIAKLNSPNLTEQDIRGIIRSTYNKANKILNGQMADPEKIRVLNQAQKLAAVNGTPSPKTSMSGSPPSSTEELPDNWSFLKGN